MVKQLDRLKLWMRLSVEVFVYGNYFIVEMCYQKFKQFDKFFFLYFIIGDEVKLIRMVKIVEYCGDFGFRF